MATARCRPSLHGLSILRQQPLGARRRGAGARRRLMGCGSSGLVDTVITGRRPCPPCRDESCSDRKRAGGLKREAELPAGGNRTGVELAAVGGRRVRDRIAVAPRHRRARGYHYWIGRERGAAQDLCAGTECRPTRSRLLMGSASELAWGPSREELLPHAAANASSVAANTTRRVVIRFSIGTRFNAPPPCFHSNDAARRITDVYTGIFQARPNGWVTAYVYLYGDRNVVATRRSQTTGLESKPCRLLRHPARKCHRPDDGRGIRDYSQRHRRQR